MFESLQEIDHVRIHFDDGSKIFLNLTIAIIMFGVALDLSLSDFRNLFKSPRPVLAGILSQFLFLPLLSCLLAIALSGYITVTVGLGMILVAACPGGNISNFMSSLAKGNIALSVSLTAFSSIAAVILTPFNFTFWGNIFIDQYGSTGGLGAIPKLQIDFWSVFLTVLGILAIPLILGMWFNHRFPGPTSKLRGGIRKFSIIAFSAIVIIIFVGNYELFIKYIKYIFIIVLVHNFIAFFTGYNIGRLFRLEKSHNRTIAIETGIQNSGLALALLFNPLVFPQDLPLGGMAFIAAWWGLWHIIAGLTLATWWRRTSL